ncbi:MAG TPA: hypothetical protein VFO67_02660 [Gemmatimonadales bacterium]|nr:hypothetical protein [Gemmatimonadales bacterium]
MLGGEALRHGDGLLILDFPGETATPLGVGESLPLRRQLPFGTGDRFLDLLNGDPGVDDGFPHLPRQRPQVGRGRRVEGGAKRVPQALEQVSDLAQLLRTVLAKKPEKTGSTDREEQFGQAGRVRDEPT